MSQDKQLSYRIAVRYESNHPIVADSPEEAIQAWQREFKIEHIPYRLKEKEWVKGGYRLVLELQEHLVQEDRDALGESISINNVYKPGSEEART